MIVIKLLLKGMSEPMIISSPHHKKRHNEVTYSMTSLLDIVPTLLDWFDLTYDNEINMYLSILTGKSLLPLLENGKLFNVLKIIYKMINKPFIYF
jgi:arylsulfatase A-like enzyme